MKINLIPLLIFFILIAIYINFIYPFIANINFSNQVILHNNPRITIADVFSIAAICFFSISMYALFPKIEKNEEVKIEETPSWFFEEKPIEEEKIEEIENKIESEIKNKNGKEATLEDILTNAILKASNFGGINISSELKYEGELELLGKKFKGDFRINIETSKKQEKPKIEKPKEEKSFDEIQVI